MHGRFVLSVYPEWDDAADDEANKTWLKAMFDPLQSLSTGHYISEFDWERRSIQAPRCFSPENWERLQEVRKSLDPDRVFVSFMGHDLAGRRAPERTD